MKNHINATTSFLLEYLEFSLFRIKTYEKIIKVLEFSLFRIRTYEKTPKPPSGSSLSFTIITKSKKNI